MAKLTTDTEIMLEIQGGDYSHIDQLFDSCKRQIHAIIAKKAVKMLECDKDDVFQDTLEAMWTKRADFNPERGAFSTWFTMLATTILNKRFDKDKQLQANEIPLDCNDDGHIAGGAPASGYLSIERSLILREEWASFDKRVNGLPENQRKAFKLCKEEGLKPAEAANLVGCSTDDLYRWLHRGNEKIKKFINDEELFEDSAPDSVA